jgi:hypothetical protein
MKADFEESEHTRHHGSRGTEREEIVARFLELYMPGTVEVVHNAEIVTVTGEVSRQCDIVIVDSNTPRLRDIRSHRIIPVESVFAVIEVKSRLTGPELTDACTKIARVKELSRTAYVRLRSAPLDFRGPQYPPPPILGYVFAFNGIRLNNLGNRFFDWCTHNPRELHPDGVWVSDTGMLVWGPGPEQPPIWHPAISDPRIERKLLFLGSAQEGDVLLGMIIGISMMLARPLPQLDLVSYLANNLSYPIEGRSVLYRLRD